MLSKVFDVFSKVFVQHQLSDPYVKTMRILGLKRFSFVFASTVFLFGFFLLLFVFVFFLFFFFVCLFVCLFVWVCFVLFCFFFGGGVQIFSDD